MPGQANARYGPVAALSSPPLSLMTRAVAARPSLLQVPQPLLLTAASVYSGVSSVTSPS